MAKKAVKRKAGARKGGRKSAPRSGAPGARKKAARKAAARRKPAGRKKAGARGKKGGKAAGRSAATRGPRAPRRKTPTRKTGAQTTGARTKGQTATRKTRRATTRSRPAGRGARAPRRAPVLERPRRIVPEEAGPPSSLDFEREASMARTGRAELKEALREHTEATPALTGGDIDGDWENAYSSGESAPGGDMPTPDQDRVDDIGRAIGVQYQDNEELKSTGKIEKRDKERWELDPASSEDYIDRSRDEE